MSTQPTRLKKSAIGSVQIVKRFLGVVGKTLFVVGAITSGVTWLATTVYFFANGYNFLGLVSLLIPPSELVLPWLVSTEFGIFSIAGVACCLVGAICLNSSE